MFHHQSAYLMKCCCSCSSSLAIMPCDGLSHAAPPVPSLTRHLAAWMRSQMMGCPPLVSSLHASQSDPAVCPYSAEACVRAKGAEKSPGNSDLSANLLHRCSGEHGSQCAPKAQQAGIGPIPVADWQTAFLKLQSSVFLLIHGVRTPSHSKLDLGALQESGVLKEAQPSLWRSQPQQASMTMHIDLEALAASRTAYSKPDETGTTACFSAATLQVCTGSCSLCCTQKLDDIALCPRIGEPPCSEQITSAYDIRRILWLCRTQLKLPLKRQTERSRGSSKKRTLPSCKLLDNSIWASS